MIQASFATEDGYMYNAGLVAYFISRGNIFGNRVTCFASKQF